MVFKNPLAMSQDELTSAIWKLQQWHNANPGSTKLPIVFSRKPVEELDLPKESALPDKGKRKERFRDPQDLRIVDPSTGEPVGVIGAWYPFAQQIYTHGLYRR